MMKTITNLFPLLCCLGLVSVLCCGVENGRSQRSVSGNLIDGGATATSAGDSCQFIFTNPPQSENEDTLYLLQSDLQNIEITSPRLSKSPTRQTLPVLQSYFYSRPQTKILILYLWSTDCKQCALESEKLRPFFSSLAKHPSVQIVSLSESPSESSWADWIKQKIFPAVVQENHIAENSTNRYALCRTLYPSSYRPLFIAIDTNMVVRQALVSPFSVKRQSEFIAGIQRLTQAKKMLSASPVFRKAATDSSSSQLATRFNELSLLHLFADGFARKTSKETPIKVLFFERSEDSKNKQAMMPSISITNKIPHQIPSTSSWVEAVSIPHAGVPITLILDKNDQVRMAFLGNLSDVQQSQFYAELAKLVRWYQDLETRSFKS